MKEKRKFKRMACDLAALVSNDTDECKILDISKNGARLSMKVKPQAEIEKISIVMPEALPGHEKVTVECKYRWATEGNGGYNAGVEFLFIEMKELMALNYLLSSLMMKKNYFHP